MRVLIDVEQDGAFANLALNKVLEKHRPGKLDRAFATELAYGVLRSLNTLDWVLGQFVSQPLDRQHLVVRNILRLGVYQLLFMDRVPPAAACNESVVLARQYGHQGVVRFVNGVLRNVARRLGDIKYPALEDDPVGHISLKHSHPVWLVKRWLKEFGLQDTIAICRADNEPAPNTIRTNTLKTKRDDLADRLSTDGLTVSKTAFAAEGLYIDGFLAIGSMESFKEGLFQVQDESSMLAGRALAPLPGTLVIDACGAPGGKTTHLAQLMKNQGRILAFDIHPHKLELIEESCARLGIGIVEAAHSDARALPAGLHGLADYVLVDAPCSGLGVLRRRPDARWRKDPGEIPAIVQLQSEILESASSCVKDGGVLLYSTCSIAHEENLGQVEDFLSRHPWFELEGLDGILPGDLDQKGTLARGYVQIYPGNHGMDGFFIARMRKKGLGKMMENNLL